MLLILYWPSTSAQCRRSASNERATKSLVSRSSPPSKNYRGVFEWGARAPTYWRDVGGREDAHACALRAHTGLEMRRQMVGLAALAKAEPKGLVKVPGPLLSICWPDPAHGIRGRIAG